MYMTSSRTITFVVMSLLVARIAFASITALAEETHTNIVTATGTTTNASGTDIDTAPVSIEEIGVAQGDPAATAENIALPEEKRESLIEQVHDLERAYFDKERRYVQLFENSNVPSELMSTSDDTLRTIPSGLRVDIYEAPGGAGYQIIYDDGITYRSVGVGPEAEERTFEYASPHSFLLNATSTATSTVQQ
jgi:hypothetical protein